mgnify:FL=1
MNSLRFVVPVFVFVLFAPFSFLPVAHGDGLTQENLPPATFGNRQAALFIKINPPILTKDTIGDTFLELKLFDAKTQDPIKHTTFAVETWKDEKLLLRSSFHTHSGDLILKIKPTKIDVNQVVVFGDQLEQLPNTWTAFGDKIDVKAPVLLESGLYHFKISIVGVDYDQNIFAEKDIKTFDSWLSVGDISNQKIDYNGKSYDATVISYYDTIANFKFDSSKKAISFSMPFNWDMTRIQGQNIFVHQEVRIPQAFKDFADSTAFQGSVNGVPTIGRMLILDPYSIEGTSILHFLVNKEDILNIAKKIPSGTKTMDFEVSPTVAVPKTNYDVKLSSGAKANISFASNLGSSDSIPIHFTFFDKDGKILKYVRYIYAIDDSTGKNLVTNLGPDPQKIGIFTTEGIDVQDYKFPKDGSYVIHLGIISHGLDEQTIFATQSPSTTTITIGKGGQVPPTQQTCPASQVLKDGKCVAITKPTDTTPKSSDIVIPSWIKNNAKYWSGNKITDKDFVNGIQYLIKQKIIKIPDTKKEGTTSTAIPSWVKNTAGFWADGKTSDSDFVKGIQYLIKSGIIKI